MKCQQINIFTKLMLTQQTFDTCKYIQFSSWLPTEYLVDKWHNHTRTPSASHIAV